MSWQATSWVIEHSKQKGSSLLVLLCIANCANESGTNCWPSKARLSRDTRMSPRQLDRIVNQLEASGELAVVHSTGRFPNHYSFPFMTNPVKMSGLPTPSFEPSNPVISDVNPVIAMAHDPSVRTISKKNSHKEPPIVPQGDVSVKPPSAVEKVFNFWKECFEHPKAKLDDKRKKRIAARLKEGYSVGELQRAIVGCSYSPFHQGQNDSKTVYDGLETILRDAAQVDKFIELEKSPPPEPVQKSKYYDPDFRPDFETFQRLTKLDPAVARETYDNSIWGSK